mmetsp:Transcript_52297/g.59365  ORF Transcript_52297/g.59365 Transcript_52297/m.59365 type:complete len:220 (-) Transcript_52297:195-854(-)
MTINIVTITNMVKIVTGLETITTVIDMTKRSILEKNFVDAVVIGVIMRMITAVILILRTIRISVTMTLTIVTSIMRKKIVTGLRTTNTVTTYGWVENMWVENIVVTVVITVGLVVEVMVLIVTKPIFLLFVINTTNIITYVWQRLMDILASIVLTIVVVVVVVVKMIGVVVVVTTKATIIIGVKPPMIVSIPRIIGATVRVVIPIVVVAIALTNGEFGH